jgi:hypothetical protein
VPTGGSAFRDALLEGCNLVLKLAQMLKQHDQAENWNIVQIVLIEGDDCGSKTDLASTIQLIYAIGQFLNFKSIKIMLIGVKVSPRVDSEIRKITEAGG